MPTLAAPAADEAAGPRSTPLRAPWRTLPGALVLLAALCALVIGLGRPGAGSGSDAGGKLATVVVMADEGTLVPDVGYWAEGQDPDGDHHPLWNTTAVGDRWVQATSLPFVAAALPLYATAGAAGALVLPVLGCLLAALAARHLARVLHGGEGWAAFWLVGAAGPALFYAGDFWEHAPALGLGLLAVASALDDDARPARALLTGVAAGLAVVLRAEMLLYGVAFVGATLVVGAERRRVLAERTRLVLTVVGAAVPVLANAVVERALLADGVRDGRAAESIAGTAGRAGSRVTDAALTSVGLFPDDRAHALLVGGLLVGSLLVLGARLAWPEWVSARATLVAGVVAASLYALRLSSGPGFVPGFLVVAPFAAAGVFGARSPKERVVLGTALGVLPLVWATAWTGNHLAQWGGRYLLLSGALLTVLAVGVAERVGWRRPAMVALATLTVVVAGFGVAWHVERTRTVGDAVAAIESRPDDVVVISDLGHLGREAGAWYGDHRWLRTAEPGGIEAAAAVARAAGAGDLAVVQVAPSGGDEPAAPALGGYEPAGAPQRIPYLVGEVLVVQRYRAR
ncbi:MAG: hypothetical protein KDB10_10725 [Acidimicrobiales bacterium]|nr:hypothetical protein [Acidimicrobiales bacterium]MCB9372567.1 hypothetical protein [Microthrixaceae bacterium]